MKVQRNTRVGPADHLVQSPLFKAKVKHLFLRYGGLIGNGTTGPKSATIGTELEKKEQLEIDFWRNSTNESPGQVSPSNILNKVGDAKVFLDCLHKFKQVFGYSERILELGAGQGWASCIVKSLYPNTHITVTDISKWALASVQVWEHIFDVKIDEVKVCKSYDIDVANSSISCVFCFSSAHHFLAHRRTLKEIYRILKPGGHCFYFYEPSCQDYFYKLVAWRMKLMRPEVPEDVLIYKKLQTLANEVGFHSSLYFYPSLIKRGPIATIYFSVLNLLPFLQTVLPPTINYHFAKPHIQ